MHFKTDADQESGILFGDVDDDVECAIEYEPANKALTFSANNNTEAMRIDSIGAVTKPLQPAFLIKNNSTQTNLPINADTTVVFDTEIFDQNADFTSNTFTAPVTGKYQLNVELFLGALDIDTAYYQLSLITSNRTYYSIVNTASLDADPTYWSLRLSILADMDASDTAYVQFNVPNSGAAQADILNISYFSGYLVA
jgi:hypothetical protein